MNGPADTVGAGRTELRGGLWLTSGRAVVLEGPDHLAVVDPGDEDCGTLDRPRGPLADVLELAHATRKPIGWVLVTHAHPDHVANLPVFRRVGAARVVAHTLSPVGADLAISERGPLPVGGGLEAIPSPGHSAWVDDLAFWLPAARTLLSGDLVQPKGETWEHAFYPSPYPYFTDGGVYLSSLEALLALPVELLVTGHREVREGEAGRRWIALTHRALKRVEEAVATWEGPEDLAVAGPGIFRALCRERGIPEEAVRRRTLGEAGQPSAFQRFDLPGIAYYWRLLRTPPREGTRGFR